MIISIILFLYGVFSLFSEFQFDENFTPMGHSFDVNKYLANKTLGFSLCCCITVVILIFMTYFNYVDHTLYNEDFESFKSLMKEHGLE
jgi:hypothetical protein